MKKKHLQTKLTLSKKAILGLNEAEQVKGGATAACNTLYAQCFSQLPNNCGSIKVACIPYSEARTCWCV